MQKGLARYDGGPNKPGPFKKMPRTISMNLSPKGAP
jgi:hypothetical protein